MTSSSRAAFGLYGRSAGRLGHSLSPPTSHVTQNKPSPGLRPRRSAKMSSSKSSLACGCMRHKSLSTHRLILTRLPQLAMVPCTSFDLRLGILYSVRLRPASLKPRPPIRQVWTVLRPSVAIASGQSTGSVALAEPARSKPVPSMKLMSFGLLYARFPACSPPIDL